MPQNYILSSNGELIPEDELLHYGVPGMKWGVRRYQDKNGRLTKKGKERYAKVKSGSLDLMSKRRYANDDELEGFNVGDSILKSTRGMAWDKKRYDNAESDLDGDTHIFTDDTDLKRVRRESNKDYEDKLRSKYWSGELNDQLDKFARSFSKTTMSDIESQKFESAKTALRDAVDSAGDFQIPGREMYEKVSIAQQALERFSDIYDW